MQDSSFLMQNPSFVFTVALGALVANSGVVGLWTQKSTLFNRKSSCFNRKTSFFQYENTIFNKIALPWAQGWVTPWRSSRISLLLNGESSFVNGKSSFFIEAVTVAGLAAARVAAGAAEGRRQPRAAEGAAAAEAASSFHIRALMLWLGTSQKQGSYIKW